MFTNYKTISCIWFVIKRMESTNDFHLIFPHILLYIFYIISGSKFF